MRNLKPILLRKSLDFYIKKWYNENVIQNVYIVIQQVIQNIDEKRIKT